MAGVQVLVRFRVLKCPPKYPLYNIKRGKYEQNVAFWTHAFHARLFFLDFYRAPALGVAASVDAGPYLPSPWLLIR